MPRPVASAIATASRLFGNSGEYRQRRSVSSLQAWSVIAVPAHTTQPLSPGSPPGLSVCARRTADGVTAVVKGRGRQHQDRERLPMRHPTTAIRFAIPPSSAWACVGMKQSVRAMACRESVTEETQNGPPVPRCQDSFQTFQRSGACCRSSGADQSQRAADHDRPEDRIGSDPGRFPYCKGRAPIDGTPDLGRRDWDRSACSAGDPATLNGDCEIVGA